LAVIEQIEDWKSGQSKITVDLIKHLQYRAIVNIYTCAGHLRTGAVSISGVDHQPPPWEQVPGLVDEMLFYVNENWETRTPVHLCAYLMWRLNWIHPFFGGNGRTARATAYLALSARLGFRLPGAKTVPDHIVDRRSAYIDALQRADVAWAKGSLDISAMEELVEGAMADQLISILSQATGKQH
jgi:Fic family protein